MGAALVLFGWIKVGMAMVVLLLASSAVVFVLAAKREASARASKAREQEGRDAKAGAILEQIRNHRPLERPLLVYLRPKAQEARFSWCIGMLGTWRIGMIENTGPYAAGVARRDF